MTTPYVLGWHRPKRKDRLARLYPAPRSSAPLRTVSWRHYGPVLNQGQVGACTGNDTVDCLMSAPLYSEQSYNEATALGVYSLAEKILGGQGYPPEDNGATNQAAAQAAVRLGLASGYTHCLDFDHFLDALQLQPIMFASEWTTSMFTPTSDGQVVPSGAPVGGHSYAAIGYDATQDRVFCLNSWGQGWGLGGTFWMTAEDADALSEGSEMIALHAEGSGPRRQRRPRGCL